MIHRDMTTTPQTALANPAFEYVFPAIRGIQAKREYYISMCPVRLIPKLFLFDEEEITPELRAQRTLNKARIPEIARYIVRNRNNYIFSALTASIDSDVHFEPIGSGTEGSRIGLLKVPMSAKFIINDGQHRRAAFEMALRENSDLGDETVAIVFFLDIGLQRCQQMFADLNRYAVRPSTSIGVLYDHRDSTASLARLVVARSPIFKEVVEMERSTLSLRSRKLFTLSAIYHACAALLQGNTEMELDAQADLAATFWGEVSEQLPEWKLVRDRKMTAGEVRTDYIHSHGIVLQAIGKAGHALISEFPKQWKARIRLLKTINWSRSNAKVWEGRAMNGGRVSKSEQNIVLTTNIIKKALKLSLTPEERRFESALRRGANGIE
jgi:DNA sulfur modification protein DndB